MLENRNNLRPEETVVFANAWLDHRLESVQLHSSILYPKIIELLQPAVGAVIADYGCGAGDLTLELLKELRPSRLIAIDLNQHLLDRFQIACNNSAEVICQDIAEPSSIVSNSVEGLVCSNVIMHLSDLECANLFKEISRVLSSTAVATVVFTHPLWAELKYRQSNQAGDSFETIRSWQGCEFIQRYRSISDYRHLLNEAGLRVDSETTIGVPDLPGLSPRYREHVKHPIFCMLELRRKYI